MTHTYTITGMHCGSCESKVKDALLSIGGVSDVQVSQAEEKAVVTMKHHVSTEVLAKAVAGKGDYQLEMKGGEHSQMHQNQPEAEAKKKSFLATYKPLLLLIGILLAGTAAGEVSSGGFVWQRAMTHFMGGYFLAFAFFKLLDLKGFVSAYAGYDLLARRWLGYGYVYPFLELGLGLWFLSAWELEAANWATLGLMLFSSVGVIRSVFQKRTIQCACLGTVFELPMSTVTIVEDLGMAAMAALMLVFR